VRDKPLTDSPGVHVPPPLLFALAFGGGLFVERRLRPLALVPATRLVAEGPYRLSRNPMYVGVLALYLGLCLLTNLAWALLFGLLPLAALVLWIVPSEERYLERRFGDDYREYRRSVRRWL